MFQTAASSSGSSKVMEVFVFCEPLNTGTELDNNSNKSNSHHNGNGNGHANGDASPSLSSSQYRLFCEDKKAKVRGRSHCIVGQ